MKTAAIGKPVGYGLVLGVLMIVAGCHGAKKQHEQRKASGTVSSTYYRYFHGIAGGREAVIQLIKYAGRYEGTFTYDSLGQPLPLSGRGGPDDSLVLVTYDHYNALDTFRGGFPQPGVFQGTVTDTAGVSSSFVMQEIYPPGTLHWQVYTLSDSLAFDTATGAPKARFRSVLLWPAQGGMPAGTAAVLTDSIAKRLYGADSSFRRPESLLHALADSFFTGYRALSAAYRDKNQGGVTATLNWDCTYDMQVLCNSDSLVSVSATSYQYMGGAHGITNTMLLSFDMKRGKALSLEDVFRPGFESKLQAVLEKHLREQYDLGSDAPLNGRDGMLFNPHLSLTSNFFLTTGGIGFVYNPYEVAPYSYGVIELYVPFGEIRDILR